ncbi:hypothetical protein PUR59_01335 [Streptomyces sp. SP18ES09]|nr:hypothetical protein [Streptomyces sp. SP18ES09]MEE1813683.1 hypothetical protein [Streptomyces sp. SP18ES09]
MDDITTDAHATVIELQQQAAQDYATTQASQAGQTHRDDANLHGRERSAA